MGSCQPGIAYFNNTDSNTDKDTIEYNTVTNTNTNMGFLNSGWLVGGVGLDQWCPV